MILKKLGAPIMTNLYYGTVKQLLERISSVMVDREAIQLLVKVVKEALYQGEVVEEQTEETNGLDGRRKTTRRRYFSTIYLHENISIPEPTTSSYPCFKTQHISGKFSRSFYV